MRAFPLAAGLALALSCGTAAAATPSTTAAPGRVVIDINGGAVDNNVDGGGAGFTVALPDGGALLVGGESAAPNVVQIVQIDRAGKLVGSFGTGGVARVDVPGSRFSLAQVLRRPDGRILLIGSGASVDKFSTGQLEVAQLTPAGALDTSFGTSGVAVTGANLACGSCTTAALMADGRIVVTGNTGHISPTPPPGDNSALRWVFARLMPNGTPDGAFGTGGVVTLPNPGGNGMNVAVLGDGRIVGEGQSGSTPGGDGTQLTRLLVTGASDPSFNAGTPIAVPFKYGFPMVVGDDGSVLLSGSQAGSTSPPFTNGDRLLVHYTASGAPDPAFGTQGVVNLGNSTDVSQLLPAAGGSFLAVTSSTGSSLSPVTVKPLNGVIVRAIAPNGSTAGSVTAQLPFGGGGSSFLVSQHPRPLPSILQNSFRTRVLTPRPDGSFIVGGGVTISTPTGEGVGRSTFRFAAASLTPAFQPDPAFGGPVVSPHLTTNLPLQRGRTAYSRHGIRVRIVASSVGLARVKVVSNGHTIAQSVVPIFHTGAQILPVELTKTGNDALRHVSHRVRVAISVSFRDLFLTPGTATAVGNLR